MQSNPILDQDIDPLARVHYTDFKPLVNSYIHQLVQTKWDAAVHGRDLYLVKPTLGPPKKFQHLTRTEEVVISRLRNVHTKAKSPIACPEDRWSPLWSNTEHRLYAPGVLQECREEYYTVDSMNTLFEKIPKTCIVEFLRVVGFFYLIWCNLLIQLAPRPGQYNGTWVVYLENESNSETHLLM